MPYKTFNNWLFDGRRDSPIPSERKDDDGKVITPDILKYNSPITHTFLISLFLRNGSLNYYLNEYFNNIGLRYLSKEEIFKFIKKCVMDFRVQKRDLMFYKRGRKNILYDKFREKLPILKNDDVELLCDIVERSDDRESIYDALGMKQEKKQKLKKTKKIKSEKISLKSFLEKHFSIIKVS